MPQFHQLHLADKGRLQNEAAAGAGSQVGGDARRHWGRERLRTEPQPHFSMAVCTQALSSSAASWHCCVLSDWVKRAIRKSSASDIGSEPRSRLSRSEGTSHYSVAHSRVLSWAIHSKPCGCYFGVNWGTTRTLTQGLPNWASPWKHLGSPANARPPVSHQGILGKCGSLGVEH